jgi:hypothetical protein
VTFEELHIGASFLFYAGGALLTKSGARTYDAPHWQQRGLTISTTKQEVFPVVPQAAQPQQQAHPAWGS